MEDNSREQDRGIQQYRRYLAGDEDGLTAIVEEYGDRLLHYINGFVRNEDVAEDLLSETFLRLVLRRRAFREESSLKTYLYAIGRNQALSWLRRHRRQREVPLETAAPVAVVCAAEQQVIRDERRALLERTLSVMHADYRDVLQLVYFEGLSCEQAASVMHKSRKQAENLLYRGKRALRTILEKEGFSYEDL